VVFSQLIVIGSIIIIKNRLFVVQESRLKSTIREFEKRLSEMASGHETELEALKLKSKQELESTIRDFRSQITDLKQVTR
jgi:hypothetical protein